MKQAELDSVEKKSCDNEFQALKKCFRANRVFLYIFSCK